MARIQMYKAFYDQGMPLIKLARGKKVPARRQRVSGVTQRESWENLNFNKNDNA